MRTPNLFKVIKAKENILLRYIKATLTIKDYSIIAYKDMYLWGKRPGSKILLVAHVDTVRKPADEPMSILMKDNQLYNDKGILGADDRAGVYLILATLYNNEVPDFDILITNYEESGCKGVKELTKNVTHFPEYHLVVELDRRGKDHYVTYCTLADKTLSYMKDLGLEKQYGSISDIAELTRKYKVPSVNLAIGYYKEHSAGEYLDLIDLQKAAKLVTKIIKDPPDTYLPVVSTERYGGNNYNSNYVYNSNWYHNSKWAKRKNLYGTYDSQEKQYLNEHGICPSCFYRVPKLQNFCSTCGLELIPYWEKPKGVNPLDIEYCPVCHTIVKDPNKACPECGIYLKTAL